MLAADVIISQKRIGNLPAAAGPVLPGGCDAHHKAGKPGPIPTTTWMTAIAA